MRGFTNVHFCRTFLSDVRLLLFHHGFTRSVVNKMNRFDKVDLWIIRSVPWSLVCSKKAIGKPVASTLHRLPSQMRVKWECTANRVVYIWDEDGKSRQPAVEPCVVHTVPYTAESYTVACCHPPTCRQESTRITEVILKCLKSLGLDCFFKAAFNKPVEFIETQNKGKVLPPCVGSCFTMLWPPNKPETILY